MKESWRFSPSTLVTVFRAVITSFASEVSDTLAAGAVRTAAVTSRTQEAAGKKDLAVMSKDGHDISHSCEECDISSSCGGCGLSCYKCELQLDLSVYDRDVARSLIEKCVKLTKG